MKTSPRSASITLAEEDAHAAPEGVTHDSGTALESDEGFDENANRASVSAREIAQILRHTGYRATVVEHQQFLQVQSSAQGLGFFIDFGNPIANDDRRFLDFSFHCWLTIKGVLANTVIDQWNQTKRFARLALHGQTLALTMDVMVAGGVSGRHLRAQCELWDRLIRDLTLHLQQPRAPEPVKANAVQISAAQPASGA